MQHATGKDDADPLSQARRSAAFAGYHVTPLESPTVSGFLPERERRPSSVYPPGMRSAREERVAVPTREVVCYECGHRSRIPVAALSAHCVHCRCHLNTANQVLKSGTRRLNLRTLGDVTLPAHVELSHLTIRCRHLTVAGRGEGTLHCTGELTLRGNARLEGQVQAGVLKVAAGARAEAHPGITADSVELEGRFLGNLHVKGLLHIGKNGILIGDCHAAQLIVDPGGRHDGRRRCANDE